MTVVAAALEDGKGQLLMQRRPPGKRHAGLWEFPGGKVERGESPRAALVRELDEELGIAVHAADMAPLAFAESAQGGGEPAIVILLYKVSSFTGSPVAMDEREIGWFAVPEIEQMPLPPLDIDLLCAVRTTRR